MIMIVGSRVKLIEFSIDVVTDSYVNWLNDPQVNMFLESRYVRHDIDSCKKFVQEVIDDPSAKMFAIFDLESGKHVGNVKLADINSRYQRAEIGILIGDRNVWGKGYASEAINLVEHYARTELGLRRITAGCYECNGRSLRLFESLGYEREGLLKEHFIYEGKFVNSVRMGKVIS